MELHKSQIRQNDKFHSAQRLPSLPRTPPPPVPAPRYVFLGATSTFKADSDLAKYEKARKLKDLIVQVRRNYEADWDSSDHRKRQMAVALYFIDKLALRAGHEKDDDEADTVGCCTLKVGGRVSGLVAGRTRGGSRHCSRFRLMGVHTVMTTIWHRAVQLGGGVMVRAAWGRSGSVVTGCGAGLLGCAVACRWRTCRWWRTTRSSSTSWVRTRSATRTSWRCTPRCTRTWRSSAGSTPWARVSRGVRLTRVIACDAGEAAAATWILAVGRSRVFSLPAGVN